MIMQTSINRPVRIAGASGSSADRRTSFAALVRGYPDDPIDVIIGDWMSEANMTSTAGRKLEGTGEGYEPSFLEALAPALVDIAKYGIKVAVNAGAADTKLLHSVVSSMVKEAGLSLKVAWVEGDEVLEAIKEARANKQSKFENICTGGVLDDWGFEPIAAQCYLGGLGIAAAFGRGMDIVLCGRVSDASPVIGAAYWWHGWQREDLNELANALVAGHLIECSTYVCGGNFTGFKQLENLGWHDIGYPIAEIAKDGGVIITKQKGTGGMVSVDTCKSQLLYEIQGPWYYNSDVTATLTDITFEQVGTDRIRMHGIKGGMPPPTTKVGITARGGFQAEMRWFLVGLDTAAKGRMLEAQIRNAMGSHANKFTVLDFTLNGTAAEDPEDQNSATVDFRILAQARKAEDLAPSKFAKLVIDQCMQTYPGGTPHLDIRQAFPKPIYEFYVTLLPQSVVRHIVHLPGESFEIAPPAVDRTKTYPSQQPSEAVTANAANLSEFGATVRGPLGWIVHARSGDKGSNANVGFWVRQADEYAWLRTLLSTKTIKQLLAKEYKGKQIDRFELPNLRAVHFLLHDHLDRGCNSTRSYDFLAKNVAEFLRARYVDIPTKFLYRGKL